MLTLERFKTMADSYGADLQRWPEQQRAAALTLLETSDEARALLAESRMLDDALAAAGARQRATDRAYEDAALTRLRSSVAARIAKPGGRPRPSLLEWTSWITTHGALFAPSGWACLTAAGGLAVLAGLVVGSLYTPPGTSDALLTLLQPGPIDNLGGLM